MTRVAIIGGGLAGLTCAYYLKRRSVDALLFEASAQTGGRAFAAPYLLGPAIFANAFELIRELNLSEELRPIEPVTGQFYRGRVYPHQVSSVAGLLRFKGLNIADKAMLPRMLLLLSRYRSMLDIHHPERGVELDDETVAAFVKRELSQNVLNYIAGPLISTLFFYGSEETSKLLYLNVARYMHNMRMYAFAGGLGRVAANIAGRIAVRVNAPVANIAVDGPEYVIEGEKFSHVVVAVPGDQVLRIGGLAALLSRKDQRFFAGAVYQRAVTAVVETSRPLDGTCYGVSIPRVENMSAAAIAFFDFIDRDSVPGGMGRLAISGGGELVSSENLVTDLTRIYPVGIRSHQAQEWRSGTPKFPPGRFREIAAFLSRKRRKGLLFCGDYLMAPLVEAAVTTGRRAADSVL
jgi:oxygen-dependent protoporphyrinogen oxidase